MSGGLQILWGNIAPDGCVVKRSAVAPEMQQHSGPARVFNSEETAIAAIYAGQIVPGDVVVIRYEGPKGGPCRMLSPVVDEVAEERTDVKVGKVNVDEQPELAGEFGVMSIPTLLVFEQGKLVRQAVGARPKASVLDLLG